MQQGDYDVVHLSAVPKMYFTSTTYTVAEAGNGCSHPLMTTGKVVSRGERLVFPLSIYVNHAFVDGSHLASFFEKIEKHLKEIFARASRFFSHNSAILKKQLGFFAVTIGFV